MGLQLLLTFPSVHYAIRAEKALNQAQIENKTIPTPREVSTSCGLCLVVPLEHEEKILSGQVEGLEVEAVYVYDKKEKTAEKRPMKGSL